MNKMAVNLDQETIKAINAIAEALKLTTFEVNKFLVSETGIDGRTMIELDIRKVVKRGDEGWKKNS